MTLRKPDTRAIHKLVKRPTTPEIGVKPSWDLACGHEAKNGIRAQTVWKQVNCKECLARKADIIWEQLLRTKGWGTA